MKDHSDNIKTIGLVLEDAFTGFAYDIIHSVSLGVKDRKDLRLVVIPGRQDDCHKPDDLMHRYKTMHNLIYRMTEQYHFDGLLLTFPNRTRVQQGVYLDVPKVYLATNLEGEVTVNYDDEPGADIFVFGFDNGPITAELTPPLASVGSAGTTLGQKALEMLLELMEGREVRSQKIPTRLYGRESLMYDMYEFTAREMLRADGSFIDRFFDNCFYRYRNEIISQGAINLRRLFFEILSRMLKSVKNRFMSEEEFGEISKLIEILFRNGIMLYTDPNQFVHDFMIWATNYDNPGEAALEHMIRQLDKIGLQNAALYLYREPIVCPDGDPDRLPETIRLKCVIRNGELFP